jgi:hypothetical protein
MYLILSSVGARRESYKCYAVSKLVFEYFAFVTGTVFYAYSSKYRAVVEEYCSSNLSIIMESNA